METPATQRASDLVDEALRRAAEADVPTSVLVDLASRIARIRNDGPNLIWLLMETWTFGDEAARDGIGKDLQNYFDDYEMLRTLWVDAVTAWMNERKSEPHEEKSDVVALSVREMEAQVENMHDVAQGGIGPVSDHPSVRVALVNLVVKRGNLSTILARIRSRVISYLSQVERELVVDRMVVSIFDDVRASVDRSLRELAPAAFTQLAAAEDRRREGTPEANSHALTSCRRALKSVADAVYPPPGEPVVGVDGRTRDLTDEKFIARLVQFAAERSQGHSSGELLQAQIKNLGDKLDALNSVASKGVHANASAAEVDAVIVQTYLTLGDVLRLAA